MTKVKICGLTNFRDALLAAESGADALGFVFAERSRRRADPAKIGEFTATLPPLVTLVGVFQDQPISYVREVMAACRLHLAQLHGNETARFIAELGYPALKAVSVATEADLDKMKAFPTAGGFLLDSGAGGTGETFDWTLAAKAKAYGKIILAGGLDTGNVVEAILRARPWGVDVAGGVERGPGVKDPDKLINFIQLAKTAEHAGKEKWVH